MSIKRAITLKKYVLKATHYSSLIYDISDIFCKFYENKNIASLSNLVIGTFTKFAVHYVKNSNSAFLDLKSVFPRPLYSCVYELIKANGERIKDESLDSYKDPVEYVFYNYRGVEIIVSYFIQDELISTINVLDKSHDTFVKMQKDFFWDILESSNLLLVNERNYRHLSLKNDDLVMPMSTSKSKEISELISTCMHFGINRSFLFYGPPGSGKSCMVKSVCKQLGLRSLRIRAEDVSKIDNDRLFDVISFIKPDIVIIEDVDKSKMNVSILELYSWLKSNVKLVMSTANKKSNLSKAMLRPGRFDEYILVDKIDDSVIYNLLGKDNKDLFDVVKDWPVAYIDELKTRFKYMPREKAIQSVSELDARVKQQENSSEDDDDEDEEDECCDEPKEYY